MVNNVVKLCIVRRKAGETISPVIYKDRSSNSRMHAENETKFNERKYDLT